MGNLIMEWVIKTNCSSSSINNSKKLLKKCEIAPSRELYNELATKTSYRSQSSTGEVSCASAQPMDQVPYHDVS